MISSPVEVSKTSINEQVPNEFGIVDFRVIAIKILSQAESRLRRSTTSTDYLVTFELSLEETEGVETNQHLSDIFNNIDNVKPNSLQITDQQVAHKKGLLFLFSVNTLLSSS